MTASRPVLRQALTMIELLVVVAVMALLASLLLPAARSVREAALTAGCAGKLRQLGQAAMVYATEHDGRLPPPRMIHGSTQDGTVWDIQLMRTLEDRGPAVRCPSDRLPKQTTVIDGVRYEGRRSYSYLAWFDDGWSDALKSQALAWEPTATRSAGARRLSQVDAAGTALLSECPGTAQGFGVPWCNTRRRIGELSAPHRQRANFAFLDGHSALHAPRDSAGSTAASVTIMGSDRGVEHAKGFWTITAGD